jgi:hypothetical protein
MVCSLPERAQRPIVSTWKWTLAAASNSAASEREIQSAGGFDMAQLPSPDGFASPEPVALEAVVLEPGSPEPVAPEPDSPAPVGLVALPADDRLEPFSLRAQPLPLK